MTRRLWSVLAVLAILPAACGGSATTSTPSSVTSASATAAAAAFPTTITDFQGRSVAITQKPQRLVSIGPSITEFLFALGVGPEVVGDDDFSDTPAAAAKVEHVGGVKVNFEKVVSLKPDVVFTVKF